MTLQPLTKEEFEALLPEEKRIRLAQDILAHLSLPKEQQRLVMDGSCYLELYFWDSAYYLLDKNKTADLQTALQQSPEPCHVCAKGAFFAIRALNYDNARISQSACSNKFSETAGSLFVKLGDFFSREQLDLMENAFEGCRMNGNGGIYSWAARMYHGEPSYIVRMQKICENLIDNRGTFVVPEILDEDWQ